MLLFRLLACLIFAAARFVFPDCGYYAFAKAQKLLEPCVARGEAAKTRVKALREGKLPRGLKTWPNDVERIGLLQLEDNEPQL